MSEDFQFLDLSDEIMKKKIILDRVSCSPKHSRGHVEKIEIGWKSIFKISRNTPYIPCHCTNLRKKVKLDQYPDHYALITRAQTKINLPTALSK